MTEWPARATLSRLKSAAAEEITMNEPTTGTHGWMHLIPHATAVSRLLTVALATSVVGTTGGRIGATASAIVT